MNDLAHDLRNARPIDLARERVEELAAAGKKWAAIKEITDAEVAKRLDVYINEINAEAKRIVSEAATEKAPHKAEIDRISGAYRPLQETLSAMKLPAVMLIEAYLKRQREITRAAGSNARPQIRGAYSPRARTLKDYWYAEVEDVLVCFVHYRNHPEIKALLTKIASHDARDGRRDIPGCSVLNKEIAA